MPAESSVRPSPASTYLPSTKKLLAAGIEGDEDVLAGLVAGLLDGFDDGLDGLFVGVQVRGEPALVADRGRQAAALEHLGEAVEDLGAHAQRLFEALGAGRHRHELLQVDVVVGVLAAVHDVHHRHRQQVGVAAADVLVERQLEMRRRRRRRSPATRPAWRSRPASPCWACRRARSASGRRCAGRSRRVPAALRRSRC